MTHDEIEIYHQPMKSNKIDLVDRGVLSAFFNAGGYVLDFNTEKFDQFTSQSVGIALCSCYKLSKGKSLESFQSLKGDQE